MRRLEVAPKVTSASVTMLKTSMAMSNSTRVKARFISKFGDRRSKIGNSDVVDGPQGGEAHDVGTIAVGERDGDNGANQSSRDVRDQGGARGRHRGIKGSKCAAQASGAVEAVIVEGEAGFRGRAGVEDGGPSADHIPGSREDFI